jgi:hypothetical protein
MNDQQGHIMSDSDIEVTVTVLNANGRQARYTSRRDFKLGESIHVAIAETAARAAATATELVTLVRD